MKYTREVVLPFDPQPLPPSWNPTWIQAPIIAQEFQRAQNGFHSDLAKTATAEKWIEIDLGEAKSLDTIVLYPSRPVDWIKDEPGFLWPVQFRLEVDGKTVYQVTTDQDKPGETPQTVKFEPVRGKKVRLVATKMREQHPGNYGISFAEIEVLAGNSLLSKGSKATASDSIENRFWSVNNLTNGTMKSHRGIGIDSLPVQQLRREFSTKSPIRKATLWMTALGVYEPRLNGKKVGDLVLAPEWTDYHSRIQVQQYDVTKQINVGKNVIGAWLGDGWYAGRIGMAQALTEDGRPRGVYGRIPALAARLVIEYADGTIDRVDTDSKWQATDEGPFRSADMLDGVVYDGTRYQSGWDTTKAKLSNWKTVRVAKPDHKTFLVPQQCEPIRVTEKVRPRSIREINGKYIVDFGQNLVGYVKLKIKGENGQEVVLRHGEVTNDDGTLYVTNLRGAPQIDTFKLSKDITEYEPKFTYHGFRFLEISGLKSAPARSDVEALVFHTDLKEIATFETSNPMLNQLWSNIRWTTRANMMSVPTDCPQRDERLGWTGDLLAFGDTMSDFYDPRSFFSKWLDDLIDGQAEDGRFPDVAPHPYGKDRHFTGAPGWGDAAVGITWLMYSRFNDKETAAKMYPAIEKYLTFLESKNPNYLWINNRGNDYGDWLNGDTLIREGYPKTGGELPKDVFATMMWYQSADRLANMTGKPRWRKMANDIKAAFIKAYVSADGKIKGDTQAGYSIGLWLGLVPESLEQQAFNHLLAGIERYQGRFSVGFHSTYPFLHVLTKFGRPDIAYKMMESMEFPGWGYSIENGATTIWERWDGYVAGRGFQDPGMNSFNHWALGACGHWMMSRMIGIDAHAKRDGATIVSIQPTPGGSLTWAKGSLLVDGKKVAVSWKKEGSTSLITVEIPDGVRAFLSSDLQDAVIIGPMGKELSASKKQDVLEKGIYQITK